MQPARLEEFVHLASSVQAAEVVRETLRQLGRQEAVIAMCWHLRDKPERVYEVALYPSGRQWRGVERPAVYDGVAIAGPRATVPAWEQRTRVLDVSDRAGRWEKLRDQPGDWIRVLDRDSIVPLPVTAFDGAILKADGFPEAHRQDHRGQTDWALMAHVARP